MERTIKAWVVALDQCFMVNRLGASMPHGRIFALERDVVSERCSVKCPKPWMAARARLAIAAPCSLS